jgi:hypothetical protein
MKIEDIETILGLIVSYLGLLELDNDESVELRGKILDLMEGVVFNEFEQD